MSKKLTHEEFMAKVMGKNEHVRNGEIEICGEYIDSKTPVECFCYKHNYQWDARPSKLCNGQGCKYCGYESSARKRTKSYEQVMQEILDLKIDVKITGTYVNEYTPVNCECLKGHNWVDKPIQILHGDKCPYCSNKKVLIGFNDIWTTHPYIACLLENPEDGYKYTYGATQKTNFICPNCGGIIYTSFNYVSYFGLSCSNCSDGISYPNKFIRQVLQQLKIDFIPEYKPRWGQSKKYDCYFKINGQEYVVEMDGIQHYEESKLTKQSLEDIRKNDELKTLLAMENNVEMIRIDCRKSEYEYISHNIIVSKLNNIFDLSKIDWKLCDANAQRSLVKEACNLYMSGIRSTKEIGNILHIYYGTVSDYLKRGLKYGWCDYDPNSRKSLCLFDKNMNFVKYFENIDKCSEYLKQEYNITTSRSGLWGACNSCKLYKGFNFRYSCSTTQN